MSVNTAGHCKIGLHTKRSNVLIRL